MRRGDIWTVLEGKDSAGKPRPAVVVQADDFDATDLITICVFTTDPTEAPMFRLRVEPSERKGPRSSSRLIVDKIITVSKSKLGERIGRLDNEDAVRLNRTAMVWLGFAAAQRTSRSQ